MTEISKAQQEEDQGLYNELGEMFNKLFVMNLTNKLTEMQRELHEQLGGLDDRAQDIMNMQAGYPSEVEDQLKNLLGNEEKTVHERMNSIIKGINKGYADTLDWFNKTAEQLGNIEDIISMAQTSTSQSLDRVLNQLNSAYKHLETIYGAIDLGKKDITDKIEETKEICKAQENALTERAGYLDERMSEQQSILNDQSSQITQIQKLLEQTEEQLMEKNMEIEKKQKKIEDMISDTDEKFNETVHNTKEEALCELAKMQASLQERSEQQFKKLWVGFGILCVMNLITWIAIYFV